MSWSPKRDRHLQGRARIHAPSLALGFAIAVVLSRLLTPTCPAPASARVAPLLAPFVAPQQAPPFAAPLQAPPRALRAAAAPLLAPFVAPQHWQAAPFAAPLQAPSRVAQTLLRAAAPLPLTAAPPSAAGPLIMASATSPSYMRRQFRAFVGTLRGTGYAGAVALFVVKKCAAWDDPRVKPWLAGQAVDLVFVPSTPCGSEISSDKVCADDPIWGKDAPMALMRFRYYAAYLDSHRGQFSHVLWTDFVDAYFQRDPFLDFHDDARRLAQTAAPAELLVFAEHDRLPISAPGFTQGWVAGCFGNEGLERMYAAAGRREIPVLCSSNVMGEVDAARDYLDAFLVQVDEAAANALGCIRPLGIDQGHHNYLIYSSMVGASARIRVAVAPYDAGPVYTAGVLAKLGVKIDRDAEGFVLRSDGHRAALVHQFNRFPELIDFVEALTAAVPD